MRIFVSKDIPKIIALMNMRKTGEEYHRFTAVNSNLFCWSMAGTSSLLHIALARDDRETVRWIWHDKQRVLV